MSRYTLHRLRPIATPLRRAQGMLIGIALVGLLTSRDVEKYGDNYQIALPIIVLG